MTYVHRNGSFRGFGTYGDILVRDRKMYVAPTPFALAEGTAHNRTLIVPEGEAVSESMVEIGALERLEATRLVVAYTFDLRSAKLTTEVVENPNAGRAHRFKAYRIAGDPKEQIVLREMSKIKFEETLIESTLDDEESDDE